MSKKLLFCIVMSFFCFRVDAQSHQAFKIPRNKSSIDIPFEFRNSFIIVNLTFNGLPVKFIVDTGAENTILSKRGVSDLLGIPYTKEFSIIGADMTTRLTAYLARGIDIQMNGLLIPNRSLLVLKEDYFNIDEFAGVQIHGVLGADILKNFTLKIDYHKGIMTLYIPNSFRPPRKHFQKIPIEIAKGKPYIKTAIQLQEKKPIDIKLLLDTGANLPLLLYTDTNPNVFLPENYIKGYLGMGLGGLIEGYLSRINQLKISPFSFNNLVTNFQEISGIIEPRFLNERDGILGNVLISRFTVILDYQNYLLYLKPIKKYNKGFDFDKSGLFIIASGVDLNQFTITEVLDNSPAQEAGLQKGDVIRRIGWSPSSIIDLRDISKKLQGKEGKKIKIIISRNGKRMKKIFYLRKLI